MTGTFEVLIIVCALGAANCTADTARRQVSVGYEDTVAECVRRGLAYRATHDLGGPARTWCRFAARRAGRFD